MTHESSSSMVARQGRCSSEVVAVAAPAASIKELRGENTSGKGNERVIFMWRIIRYGAAVVFAKLMC